jgi:hypothetical protein
MTMRMKLKRPKPLDFSEPTVPAPTVSDAIADEPLNLDLRHFAPAEPESPPMTLAPEPMAEVIELSERAPTVSVEAPTPDPSPRLGPTLAAVQTARAAPRALPIYIGAGAVAVLWALCPIAFAIGYRRDILPFQDDFFAIFVFGLMSLGPPALVFFAAYLLHQGAKLAAETRRAQALADGLSGPATLAAHDAGAAVEAVRQEINQAARAAAEARAELLSLREVLAVESQRLFEAAQTSARSASNLTGELSVEREKMSGLASVLDTQAAHVAEVIGQQARMVAEASDLAETQIREAEAALAARAADLAVAATDASEAARLASEDLARQTARLETASLSVGDQMRIAEDGLGEQRAALVAVAHGMRADHEAFAAQAETQIAQLNEALVEARTGAGDLAGVAARSSETLRELIAAAASQLRDMAEAAAAERESFAAASEGSLGAMADAAARERQAIDQQTRGSIDALAQAAEAARQAAAHSVSEVAEAAAREQQALEAGTLRAFESLTAVAETARRAAADQADIARSRIDELGEAAFAAGQKADAVFEARLNDARALIEQSVQLVEEAGHRSAERLGEGVAMARATLSQLEAVMGEVDARIAQLPADAQVRTEAVRETIEKGMAELMASARRAAEETQTIDAAFQERVRRNYDMLSEAVRLMGVVAGAASTAGQGQAARATAPHRSIASTPAVATPPVAAPTPRPAEPGPSLEAAPIRAPAAKFRPTPAPESINLASEDRGGLFEPPISDVGAPGLRPRLKLTPTATDEEFKTVFEAAGGREPAPARTGGGDEPHWTWKDLLSSMDEPRAAGDGALADTLLGEIEGMGIDASALLPRARIDEVAFALDHGETQAGRQVVRRIAPAAIRRLSRRMIADRAFRAQSDQFIGRYRDMVADSVLSRGDPALATSLLGSDQGRAFLLLDAAASEAG